MSAYEKSYYARYGADKSSASWQHYYLKKIMDIEQYADPPLNICDIGCGQGYFLEACENIGWDTYGIDISEFAISRSRAKSKFLLCDVQQGIPFDIQFDVVTCFDIIEHLADPEKAIRHIYDHLKEGGVLLLSTPNPRSRILGKISSWQDDPTHLSVKPKKDWEALLSENHFKMIYSITEFPTLQFTGFPRRMISRVLSGIGYGSTVCIMATR